MISNANTNRRRLLLGVGLSVLILVCVWVALRGWDLMCGNYRTGFYGRVVDVNGNGMSGVIVKLQVLSSGGPALPVMFGRPERTKIIDIVTRKDGCFDLVHLSGYGISIRRFTWNGNDLWQAGPGPWPDVSWSLENPKDWATLPTQPEKRLTYHLVPHR